MTTTPTSTDPVEDAAPVATEDAADATTATAAAGQGSSDEAAHDEGDDAEAEAEATAPAVDPRVTPAGATDLADALRAARADQRRADGTQTQAGTPPAPAADAATTQRADPAHSELVQETEPTDAPAEEPAAAEAAPPEAPATYEAFVATLSEPQRKLVDDHITGLKGALQAERVTVKKLEAQAKVAQALAEEKTKLEADVASVRSEAQLAQHRADFYENAIDQGVRRKSVRLAYLAALDAGHLNEDGSIAWDGIRAQFADLFEAPGRTGPTPPSRSSSAAAGAGARQDTPAAPTLNQIIRNAAGRR